jgi:hypothetical protein
MSPQTTPIDLKDPSPHINAQIESIAIQIGCPIRVLKGSERGELASSQDDAKWNDRVQHRQNFHVTPMIIVQFIDRLIQIGVLPQPKGYTVRWPDLDSNGDQARAQIAMTVIQALGTYVGQNVESLISPHKILTKYLHWDDDEATDALDETKQAHAMQDTMSNPPQIAGQPAAPAEGTAAKQGADDARDAAQAKADAIAQSGNDGEGGGGDEEGDEGSEDNESPADDEPQEDDATTNQSVGSAKLSSAKLSDVYYQRIMGWQHS